ncbi:hypothetical protein ACXJJ3_20730 [Kribbella sp. WER1]
MAEDPAAEVARLHQELLARPDDGELRVRLARSIRRMTEASLAVTSYQVRLIASERQLELARRAVQQIVELAPSDGELSAFATGLNAEVDRSSRWVWQSRTAAIVLTVGAVVAGLGLVVAGGLTDDVGLVGGAAVISSVTLAGIVLAFRRQTWQVDVRSAGSVIEYHGI